MSDSLILYRLSPDRLLCPWNSPGKNTGLCSYSLLQGIFPTGTKPRSSTSQADSYHLSHQGSPRILEWVAYPFSRDLSDPGINQGLLKSRRIFYHLSYQGSPYILLCIYTKYKTYTFFPILSILAIHFIFH